MQIVVELGVGHFDELRQGRAGEVAALVVDARLFGASFNDIIREMRIGIVGGGGTGSPVAMLLMRLGARRLALIDPDVIEDTNLNRVHGSRRADADAAMRKVDILAREIDLAGLGTQVITVSIWMGPHGRAVAAVRV